MDEFFVKLIGGVLVLAVVVYIVIFAVLGAALIACICLGFVSVFIVKSAKALVRENEVGSALLMSSGWAAVLTVGCILGSFGLLWSMSFALGQSYSASMMRSYELHDGGGFWSIWMFLDQWIIMGAYLFFAKTAAALYLANRVFLARRNGGRSWLGVVPPIGAMLLFFTVDHWPLVGTAIRAPTVDNLTVLLREFWSLIYLPFDLVTKAFTNPDAVLNWAKEKIISSNGSMFKLATLFPSVFGLLALAALSKALTGIAASGQ